MDKNLYIYIYIYIYIVKELIPGESNFSQFRTTSIGICDSTTLAAVKTHFPVFWTPFRTVCMADTFQHPHSNALPMPKVVSSYVTPWQLHSPVSAMRYLGRVPVVIPEYALPSAPMLSRQKQLACQEPKMCVLQWLNIWSCNVIKCI